MSKTIEDKALEKAKNDYVDDLVEDSCGTEYGGELGWNAFMEIVKPLSRQEFIDHIVSNNGFDEEDVIANYFSNKEKPNE